MGLTNLIKNLINKNTTTTASTPTQTKNTLNTIKSSIDNDPHTADAYEDPFQTPTNIKTTTVSPKTTDNTVKTNTVKTNPVTTVSNPVTTPVYTPVTTSPSSAITTTTTPSIDYTYTPEVPTYTFNTSSSVISDILDNTSKLITNIKNNPNSTDTAKAATAVLLKKIFPRAYDTAQNTIDGISSIEPSLPGIDVVDINADKAKAAAAEAKTKYKASTGIETESSYDPHNISGYESADTYQSPTATVVPHDQQKYTYTQEKANDAGGADDAGDTADLAGSLSGNTNIQSNLDLNTLLNTLKENILSSFQSNLPSNFSYDYDWLANQRNSAIDTAVSDVRTEADRILNKIADTDAATIQNYIKAKRASDAKGLTSQANTGKQASELVQSLQTLVDADKENTQAFQSSALEYLANLLSKKADTPTETATTLGGYYTPLQETYSNLGGNYLYSGLNGLVNALATIQAAQSSANATVNAANISAAADKDALDRYYKYLKENES